MKKLIEVKVNACDECSAYSESPMVLRKCALCGAEVCGVCSAMFVHARKEIDVCRRHLPDEVRDLLIDEGITPRPGKVLC